MLIDIWGKRLLLCIFERDAFSEKKGSYQSSMAQYEFVNIWPTDLTSMRVAYGEPNVLQCSVQFAYDRFFTTFENIESESAVPVNRAVNVVNSNDQVKSVSGLSPSQRAKVNFGYDLNVNQ